MIITKIIANLHEDKFDKNLHIEKIFIKSDDSFKKILRLKSDHGEEFGLKLPKNSPALKDGDIIFQDDKNLVTICFLKDEILKIVPKNITQMGKIAHYLGNRHIPIDIIDENIILAYDKLIEQTLLEKKIYFKKEKVVLKNAFKYIGH